MSTARSRTRRMIHGVHGSWEQAHRDQRADEEAALAANPDDARALWALYLLGYDMSQARITRSAVAR